ncbi:MAG: hypothetical protein GYA24_19885 [Candidatus Lokiarchaeota archaeon]|nr:hypothetical protein [Candidatus Lokiarchaeota archaeon]
MAEELPTKFKTVPYSSFFKLWYFIQKELPEDVRKTVLMRVGRAIGNEFKPEGIETIDQFLAAATRFVVEEWGITDAANFEAVKEGDKIVRIIDKLNSCKMCFGNTYFKLHDQGHPECMFPHVMMAILGKVRAKFGFKNIAFENVKKPGPVGECIMTWRVN